MIAVIVNLALLGIGGSLTRMFPNMTPAQRILLIIVIEVCKRIRKHVLLCGISSKLKNQGPKLFEGQRLPIECLHVTSWPPCWCT